METPDYYVDIPVSQLNSAFNYVGYAGVRTSRDNYQTPR